MPRRSQPYPNEPPRAERRRGVVHIEEVHTGTKGAHEERTFGETAGVCRTDEELRRQQERTNTKLTFIVFNILFKTHKESINGTESFFERAQTSQYHPDSSTEIHGSFGRDSGRR